VHGTARPDAGQIGFFEQARERFRARKQRARQRGFREIARLRLRAQSAIGWSVFTRSFSAHPSAIRIQGFTSAHQPKMSPWLAPLRLKRIGFKPTCFISPQLQM
jgi:hypothetical protein